jgi:hypothetical protein
LIRVTIHIASAIRVIFTQNTTLMLTVVASLANSSTPDTAFTANPIHMIEKNFSSGLMGIPGAPPSRRRFTTTVQPTTRPRPMVCNASTIGKAMIDCDSRSQVLTRLASSHMRRFIMEGTR